MTSQRELIQEFQTAIDGLGPSEFAANTTDDGRGWMAGLGELVAELCDRWSLRRVDGAIGHGYNAVVIPVIGSHGPSVLKVAWPTSVVVDEEMSLRAWAGHGAVEIYEADIARGALLLERLDPTRTLHALDLEAAASEAGLVLRELSIDAPAGIPSLADAAVAMSEAIEARRHLLDGHLPNGWIDSARALLTDLSADIGNTLVHTDLHYGNILAGTRLRWAAIDPKPFAGDPERAVAELLWTRADELVDSLAIQRLLGTIVATAGLDLDKAAAWAFVRTLDYWMWSLECGLTEDPRRCHRVAHALAPLAIT